jgi:hypothetical protein
MKKLLGLVLVLAMASLASASFLISVDGNVDPSYDITLSPSADVNINIDGVGNGNASQGFWLLAQNTGIISGGTTEYIGAAGPPPVPGSLNEIATKTTAGWVAYYEWEEEQFTGIGYAGVTSASAIVIGHGSGTPLNLNGVLVDNILFHCEGFGTVTLTLLSNDFAQVFDTQIIHQIPEPATIALLCLGGLLLRKKR